MTTCYVNVERCRAQPIWRYVGYYQKHILIMTYFWPHSGSLKFGLEMEEEKFVDHRFVSASSLPGRSPFRTGPCVWWACTQLHLWKRHGCAWNHALSSSTLPPQPPLGQAGKVGDHWSNGMRIHLYFHETRCFLSLVSFLPDNCMF